jgi:hypothetical protein
MILPASFFRRQHAIVVLTRPKVQRWEVVKWERLLAHSTWCSADLAHNVEAYSGIPGLFFTWALRQDKRVHLEFLDNSVAEGHRPRTAAFGLNGRMNIVDLACLLDIDRYRNVNIEAQGL